MSIVNFIYSLGLLIALNFINFKMHKVLDSNVLNEDTALHVISSTTKFVNILWISSILIIFVLHHFGIITIS